VRGYTVNFVKMSTPPPSGNKSAMARTLERLKARKKNASPLVKIGERTGSTSEASSSPMTSPTVTPIASPAPPANMITYSFSQNDGTVKTVPLAMTQVENVLMPAKTVRMAFLFACHVVFNVPVNENQRRAVVQRDFVAHVFNYGTVFVTGSEINEELKPFLTKAG
jgi:hypothetical protein